MQETINLNINSNDPITNNNNGGINNNNSQKKKNLSFLRKNLKYFILFGLSLLFIYWMQNSFSKFLNRSQFNSGTVNTRCNPPPEMIQEKPQFCQYKSDMQFTKFLWFLSDGLSLQYSQETVEHFQDNSVLLVVDVPGPKFSHAIYSSYLTGQLPTNYKGSPIKSDNLIKSMNRAKYNLTYVGPEWSFLAILGESNYKTFFGETGVYIRNEALTAGHTHGYPFFFETHEERNWFHNTILSDLVKYEGSLLTHSAIFDHASHGEYRSPNGPNVQRLERLGRKYSQDLNELKKWIDQHPDYLLILSSDHGVDDISKGYVLHGYSSNGNEGYVMLYNPNLKPMRKRVDIVDVCSTVSSYLKGVDIPQDNIGVSQAFFDNFAYESLIAQQNVAQLLQTSKQRGVLSNSHANKGKELLSIPVDPKNLENHQVYNNTYLEIKREAESLKSSLYSLINPPWARTIFHFAISILLIAFIIIRYNSRLTDYLLVINFSSGVSVIALIFLIYSGMFINVLFCWDTWRGVFDSGAPIFVWQGGLVLLVFFILNYIGTYEDLEPSQRNLVKRITLYFFATSLVDMTYFFLRNIFRQQWKYFFQIPYISIPLYILLIFHVSDLCGYSSYIKRICCFCFFINKSRKLSEEEKLQFPKNNPKLHLLISFVMISMIAFYELTINEKSYFSFYQIHFSYAYFLIFSIFYILYIFLFNFQDLHLVLIPLTIYQFALSADVPHMRFLLVMFFLQYRKIIAPLLSLVAVAVYNENKKKNRSGIPRSCTEALDSLAHSLDENGVSDIFTIFSMGGIGNFSNTKQKNSISKNFISQLWNVLPQAIILIIINLPFYHFYVAVEEKLNIDAHPFAGGVGMEALDANPNFNAFQMAFEKYCPFFTFVFILWYIYFRAPPASNLISSGKVKSTVFLNETSKSVSNNNNNNNNEEIPVEQVGGISSTTIDIESSPSSSSPKISSTTMRRDSYPSATNNYYSGSDDKPVSDITSRLEYQRYKDSMEFVTGLTSTILALFFNNTVWFLHLLLCFISNRHGFEQAAVFLMLIGIFTTSFYILRILTNFGGILGLIFGLLRIKKGSTKGSNSIKDIVSTFSTIPNNNNFNKEI